MSHNDNDSTALITGKVFTTCADIYAQHNYNTHNNTQHTQHNIQHVLYLLLCAEYLLDSIGTKDPSFKYFNKDGF